MKIVVIIFFLIGFLFVTPSTSCAQGGEPENKILKEKEKIRAKERKQAEKELNKHHSNIQSKATRKRMKAQKKRSNRLKKKKTADPFWKKWFRK